MREEKGGDKMGGAIFGFIAATMGWFITGYLDLSWISEFLSKLFG